MTLRALCFATLALAPLARPCASSASPLFGRRPTHARALTLEKTSPRRAIVHSRQQLDHQGNEFIRLVRSLLSLPTLSVRLATAVYTRQFADLLLSTVLIFCHSHWMYDFLSNLSRMVS
jgi:hypothetical protein